MLPLERLLLIGVGTIIALSASWYWFFTRRNTPALRAATKRAVDEEEVKPKTVSAPSRKQRQLPVVVSAVPAAKPVKAKKEEVPYEKLSAEDKEKILSKIKEEGNNFYKAGDWMRAISCYSDAIEKSDSNNAVFLNNRSAAYIQIRDFTAGLKDAERVVELEPENLKGLFRVATCYANLRKHDLALNAAMGVLKLQPDHKEAQEIVKQSNQILQEEQIRLSEQNRKLQQETEDEAEEINAETVVTEVTEAVVVPPVEQAEPVLPEKTEPAAVPEEEDSGVVIEHNVTVSEAVESEEEIIADSLEAHPVLENVEVAPLVEETKTEPAEEQEDEIVADQVPSQPEEPIVPEETVAVDNEDRGIEAVIPAEVPAEEQKQEDSEEEIIADEVAEEPVKEEVVSEEEPAVAEETAGLTINNEDAQVEAAVPAEEAVEEEIIAEQIAEQTTEAEQSAQFEEVQQADASISETQSEDIAVPEETAGLEVSNEDREVEAAIPAESPVEEVKQEDSEEEIIADEVAEEPAHEDIVPEETAGLEIQNEYGVVEPAIVDEPEASE